MHTPQRAVVNPRAPYGSGGDMFYDDNEWVGLAKVQLHLQTKDSAALARAKEIFELVRSGWDGVNVLLYKATHDRTYLRRAERIAEAAYAYYVTQGRLFTQPVHFNSIFFKNLLLLESVSGDGKYRQAMADYADEIWSTMRDPGTGLVHFNSSGGTEALQQAAFAQLYAVLAWPRELWPTLY